MLLRMTTAMNRRPTDTLPLRLVMLRHEASVSQREAAFRCGITPRVWQGMEEGRSTAKLLDIGDALAGFPGSMPGIGGPGGVGGGIPNLFPGIFPNGVRGSSGKLLP